MDQIFGQDRAIAQLQDALRNGRMHHAFIFHGPEGVGKCTTARALARMLLCSATNRDEDRAPSACGQCKSCRLADDDAHPDLHVVTKELARFSRDADTRKRKLLEFPVKVIEEQILHASGRSPVMHHGKIFIIDEADLLSNEGQNILLKTLEEPPAGTHIILVSCHEEKLLPTIRSRCQRVAFSPLPDETVRTWLRDHHRDLDSKTHEWVVEFAAGSLGRVELTIAYGLKEWSTTILGGLKEMTRGTYPTTLGQQMTERINGFAESWGKEKGHENASKDAANKRAAALMWSLIGQFARTQLRLAASSTRSGEVDDAESTLAPWLGVIDAVGDGERELRRNVNLALVMNHAVSKMYRALTP